MEILPHFIKYRAGKRTPASKFTPPRSLSPPPFVSIMETKSRRPNGALSSLNAAVDALQLARDAVGTKPTKDALDSASVLLTTIRVSFLPVHVHRTLAHVCRTQ